MNVYSSSIHNHQRLETTQMSFNKINKLGHPYHRILLSKEKDLTLDTSNMDVSQRYYPSERSQSQSQYNSIYMTFL